MKYSESNKPLICMQTNSACYKSTRKMEVKGILWHSTGANNPMLKRYVQPADNSKDYKDMIDLLGKNVNKNDYNHSKLSSGLNAFIGKLEDGTIATVQTMPWNYRPWGCGSGNRGTCNDGWIQFEICEDSLKNEDYFIAVYKEAIELCAYLCKMYSLNPKGLVNHNGVSVPVITCHADAHFLGLGSNHSDIHAWFKRYDKTMDDIRNDIEKLLKDEDIKYSKPKKDSKPRKEVYRVRRSWYNTDSQIGAFSNLENAKKACKKGYLVFDSNGKVVYSKSNSKTLDQIAREVIAGKWGTGEIRKKKLTAAGYNYNEVQSMVNKLCK